jgi:hypothetical protein
MTRGVSTFHSSGLTGGVASGGESVKSAPHSGRDRRNRSPASSVSNTPPWNW